MNVRGLVILGVYYNAEVPDLEYRRCHSYIMHILCIFVNLIESSDPISGRNFSTHPSLSSRELRNAMSLYWRLSSSRISKAKKDGFVLLGDK